MPRLRLQAPLAALLLCACYERSLAAILYVSSNAGGGGNGLSWSTAFNSLTTAISTANFGDQIWVARGTHRPGSLRTDSFQLKDGVEVYGGFAGTENPAAFSLDQRDFLTLETILEGEIGAAGVADNVFHVVTAANVSRSAILDGFTIAHGNASGLSLMQQDVGGALLVNHASPAIRWCLIRDSQAGSRGGAVHIAGGSPYFSHCRFVGSRTTVTQAANNFGGGIYFAGTSSLAANPTFVDCLFVGNRAGVGNGGTGGAIYGGQYGQANVINCTFLHNRADTLTAGVFGTATISNCIFYCNQDHNGLEVTAQLMGTITASHSLVQGGWPGAGNLNADPLFANALGADGISGTIDDDAHLKSGSPCIDAGSNFAWPDETATMDLDGAPRFLNDPAALDTGEPSGAAILDMGAFEKQSPCTNSAQCQDGLFCNGEEFCQDGSCQPGLRPVCADDLECTLDRCSEATRACVHEPDDRICDDGRFCNGLETCDADSGCKSASPPDCDDGVACTIDVCDAQLDQCTHTASDAACDDAVFCNGLEVCNALLGCVTGADPCDDGIDCTTAVCDEENHRCAQVPDDTLCDDGQFCNGAEICGSQGCAPGVPPCVAGQACNEALGQCIAPPPPPGDECSADADCPDVNPCTDDHCVLGTCQYAFNAQTCNDGNPCTAGDHCLQGACVGTPIAGCGVQPPDPDPDGGPPGTDPPEGNDNEQPPDGSEDPGSGDGESPQPVPDPGDEEPDPPTPPLCLPGEPCDEDPSRDADQDGVPDRQDKCPDTGAGVDVDQNGCPLEDTETGRGIWTTENSRRCGACGSMGLIGVIAMVCVPATVLITGRTRGRKKPDA